MLLLLDGHDYRFEMENLCRLFVPREKIVVRVADDAFPVSGSPEEAGITPVTIPQSWTYPNSRTNSE